MSQASNYLETAILKALFGIAGGSLGTLSSAPTIHVALLTAAPDDASTGSTITEANYTGYARKAFSDWTEASGTVSNNSAITFDPCTAGTSTVTHFALVDAASGGNVLCYGALSASLVVSSGITPQFATGELDVSLA